MWHLQAWYIPLSSCYWNVSHRNMHLFYTKTWNKLGNNMVISRYNYSCVEQARRLYDSARRRRSHANASVMKPLRGWSTMPKHHYSETYTFVLFLLFLALVAEAVEVMLRWCRKSIVILPALRSPRALYVSQCAPVLWTRQYCRGKWLRTVIVLYVIKLFWIKISPQQCDKLDVIYCRSHWGYLK